MHTITDSSPEPVLYLSPAPDAVVSDPTSPDAVDPAPAPSVVDNVSDSAAVVDLVTTASPHVADLPSEADDSMPPADILDAPTCTREEYHEYQDPELSTPRVKQELKKAESERDSTVLTMLSFKTHPKILAQMMIPFALAPLRPSSNCAHIIAR